MVFASGGMEAPVKEYTPQEDTLNSKLVNNKNPEIRLILFDTVRINIRGLSCILLFSGTKCAR